MLACHVEDHGFKSRSIRMIFFNFRKILKILKKNIKNKFLFFNKYFKKNFFYKFNLNFIFFYNKQSLKIKNNNFIILYFLKNIGNINSCIRTIKLFNSVSIIKLNIKNKIISCFNNVFFIKKISFFLFFIKKKKVLISLTTKSKNFLKKIKIKINFVLLIGNEKNSLKKKYFLKSDFLLKIKTYCKKSLNVNVVLGIILFNFK